jgi:hypothetical protein
VSSSEPEQHKAALEHALKPLGARNLSTFLFRSAVFFNRSSAHFWVHSNSVAAKKEKIFGCKLEHRTSPADA